MEDTLPHEVWALVFGFLSYGDLRSVAGTCRVFLCTVRRTPALELLLQMPVFSRHHTHPDVHLSVALPQPKQGVLEPLVRGHTVISVAEFVWPVDTPKPKYTNESRSAYPTYNGHIAYLDHPRAHRAAHFLILSTPGVSYECVLCICMRICM
eukprot:TRINITY_DN10519_c0_g1_i1.p1 TRINITY_DN10519_c0_g1~~TRINITY_DN10519_c0_g1_i1.p1  ORF type:complete len:152 (+),score=4.37 TRINITY_DN10519_c0_g1_i1:3-458(+)